MNNDEELDEDDGLEGIFPRPSIAKFIRLSHRIAVNAHFPTAGFKFVVPLLSSVPVWYPSSFPRSGSRSVATDHIGRTIPSSCSL